MKILVVEDDFALRKNLIQYLSSEGYMTESAKNLKEAIEKIKNYDYDICVLDVMLPDGNGLDFIPQIKKRRIETGIIVLSARGELADKLSGLNQGADDYLPKPFHLQELSARIMSIIRRRNFLGSKLLTFGLLTIDPESRKVTKGQEVVDITGKEFSILLFMITNKNKVLSKEAIAAHIWGDYIDHLDSMDFLYTHIKNLRKKLTSIGMPESIKSVYGIGYKLEDA